MRLGIKGKQVLGVTTIVGVIVVVLSLVHLARLAQVSLDESRSRAELVADAILHRAREVVRSGAEPHQALKSDAGLRSILESSLYSKNVTFAAIADDRGIAVAHADPTFEGSTLTAGGDLDALVARSPLSQLRAIYSAEGRNLEFRQRLFVGNDEFGSIRIGVSTLLIRRDLDGSLGPSLMTALAALLIAVFSATVLAQLMLRPIHVIRSGLTRLGRGELGVRLDINRQDEFGELGAFFNAVSEQISADRSQMADQVAHLESAVEHLEDAVAIVSPDGELLFANPAMRGLLPGASVGARLTDLLSADHPLAQLAEQTLASRQSRGPVSATFGHRAVAPGGDVQKEIGEPGEKTGDGLSGERLILTHPVNDPGGKLVGIIVIARNLEYLGQVQSTIRYSRKLAALGKLSAGVAHEVKNPLNAMMIHLELLKQQFAPQLAAAGRAVTVPAAAAVAVVSEPPPADRTEAAQHLDVIAGEIRRLDQVLQGFLRFTRPEDLKWQPVPIATFVAEVIRIVGPEAERTGVELATDCDAAPDVNGDPTLLRQAFLNLALNACQAMPNGGALRIRAEPARGRRIAVTVEDTGAGIAPEHLSRIFDLYFTTRPNGSGIGLSMVYRTVQMHDGEIEVESTPGAGTIFTVLLPRA